MSLLKTIEEVKALDAEGIKKVTNLSCLATVFGNGPSGRKVETAEMKALDAKEREALAAACREDLVAASQV